MELPTLQTPRLVLRPFELSDARDLQRLCGTHEVADTTLNIPHPYEDGMAEAFIATHKDKFERVEAVHLAVVLKPTGQLIGGISLGIENRHNHAEIGYVIALEQWRKGYCTEAAGAMVQYGFEVMRLNRIEGRHMTRNPASGRVMQKIGMKYEGCLRQYLKKWDKYEDLATYSLLAREYRRGT